MQLALEQDVLDLVGQSQRTGNNSTAKATLELVTTQIENHVGTPLSRFTRVDYFGCPKNINGASQTTLPTQDPEYLLNLTAGFIDETQPFTVYYSTDDNQITAIPGTNTEVVDPVYYALDARLGRLTLYGSKEIPDIPFRSIAVSYTSGFVADEQNVYQDVPANLKHAAISETAYQMRVHATQIATNRTPYKEFFNVHRRTITGLLSAYIRPRATGDEPQYATATAVP